MTSRCLERPVTGILQVEYRVEQHKAKLGDRQAREGADRGV